MTILFNTYIVAFPEMSRYGDTVDASKSTNGYSMNRKPRRTCLGDKTLSMLLVVPLEENEFDFMRPRLNFGRFRCTSGMNGTEQNTCIAPQYF